MKAIYTLLLTGFAALLMAQPANDECANAVNISSIEEYCSGAAEFTTTDATTSTGFGIPNLCSPAWDGDQNDVWFTFSTTSDIIDVTIAVTGTTMQQPQIAIYRGDCSGFGELSCIQAAAGSNSVSLDVLALDPSETYYLRINAATTGADGDFQLCIGEFSSNVISNVTTTECTGLLYDTGGPDGNYGAFEDFQFVICPSDPHDCIAITINEYDIEPIFDNLSIYDGADDTAPLLESIDGQSNGQINFIPIETTGCVTIGFTTDGGMFRSGFELTWECTQGDCPPPPPDFITCSGTFYDSGGPNGNYNNEEMEQYIICPDTAYTCLNLTFVEYDIETVFDFINVYEGQGVDNGTYLGTLDGIGGGITFHTEDCFTIEFQSDFIVNNPGWEATWQCTQEMCPPDGSDIDYPDLTDCSGTFFDSGGDSTNYLNNENWDFNICPSDTNIMCIILNVNTYELPSDGDALTIYEGPDTSGEILGQYFVSGAGDEIQTPSNCVTIAFQSNAFITAGGFDISWQCTEEECTIDTPIVVDPDATSNDLADIIAADGVVISNVTLDCPGGSYGTFDTPGNCNLGMENGIVLTNGTAEDAEGPDSGGGISTDLFGNGDMDLDDLLSQGGSTFTTQDACILEFDVFAPTNMLSFNYSFGSEEYPEFAPPNPNTFNDVFGFFISGPGISGPFTDDAINIALIPGTNSPVSIDNLNAVTNNQYYIDNQAGLCLEYDAFTTVLTASADVIACETYHIKLAVADVGDGVFDSGVFIQAQSLSTGAASIVPTYEYSPDIDVAIEGCATGLFNISLDGVQTDTTVIYIDVGGTATNGEDFEAIPDSLVFFPGDTVLSIPINPIEDGIDEGLEQAIIYLTTPTECGNIQTDSAVIEMQDFIDLDILPESPFITCANATFEITANNALGYQWNTGDTTASITVTPTESITYYVTGSVGNCAVEDSIQIIISELNIQTTSVPISCFENGGSIVTDVNGGIAPFSYEWSDATIGDVQNPADLPEGTYSVTVTDANDCTGTSSVEILSLDPLVITTHQDTTGTCGGNNAQATVTIVNQPTGDFDITYEWDDGQNTATAIGLSPGEHTVTVTLTDVLGNICSETDIINIYASPSVHIDLVATPEGCGEGGTISVVIISGLPPFEYSIDGINFQTDSIFTGLSAGDYTIIAQDSEGCATTAQETVGAPPMPILTGTSDEATCGSNSGSITLTASGGIPPYQYSIDNCVTFQTSPEFIGLTAGMYNVCVIDAVGCQANNTINVLETDPLQINVSDTYSTECGQETATVTIDNVTGGVQNYEYSINGGIFQADNTFTLAPGTYTLVVRDATGCTASTLITVEAFPGPVITPNLNNPSMCGAIDGTIQIFTTGGAPPLEYSNDGGANYQSTPIFTGLGAGMYTLVVGDNGGCYDTLMVNLTDPDAPLIMGVNTENPMCSEDDGFIEILINDGNPNYEYSIDNGVTFQGSNTFEDLPAGDYEIIVEDFLGCRAASMVTLTQAGAPEVTDLEATPATCGDSNGTLDVTVNGGSPPYIYSINGVNFLMENNFFNLDPGVYTVTVQDSLGCTTEILTQIITTGSLVIGDITTSNPSSCDVFDGSINIFANGGTPPYEFSIDNGVTTQSDGLFTDLDAGEYEVVVMDINGCAAVRTVQLATYDNPEVTTINVEDTKCNEDEGTIDIFVSGGTPNYQYSIDGGMTFQGGNSFNNLPGGVYNIVIEDFTGCQVIGEVTINSTDSPVISDLTTKDPACGDENGTITLTVTDGTPAYEYSIDGGANFQSNTVFNDLGAGIYDIVIRDAEGCETYEQVILTDNGELIIGSIDVDDSICDGENGSLTVSANGGTSPYQYSVDNGTNYQSGNVFSGLPPGTYNVVVQDANECTTLQTVDINSSGVPEIDDLVLTAATCGNEDGIIEITASSGSPEYQYSINGGGDFQSSNTFVGLAAGTYDVIVEDAIGCQANTQVEILPTAAAAPQITTDGSTDFCFDENITLNAGNFVAYAWSTNEETQSITTNQAGTYFVTVTDSEGCIGIGEITLTVTDEFTVDAGEDVTVGLAEDFDLSVVFVDSDLTYSWSGSNGMTANGADVTFAADQVGTFIYTVTATVDGCEVTDEVTVTVADRSSYSIPNVFSPNDDNLNEIFRVVKTESVDILEFRVFNRWGEVMYDNPTGEWDGKFRGQDQVSDVYTYYIVLRLPNTEQVELAGDVLLMR